MHGCCIKGEQEGLSDGRKEERKREEKERTRYCEMKTLAAVALFAFLCYLQVTYGYYNPAAAVKQYQELATFEQGMNYNF